MANFTVMHNESSALTALGFSCRHTEGQGTSGYTNHNLKQIGTYKNNLHSYNICLSHV